MKIELRHRVLDSLLKIPKGKITTYGELARYHKTSPRAIASILRANKNPHSYPCYKVVMSSGKIGGYCGSDPKAIRKKITLLKKDGMEIQKMRIELSNYLFKFT